MEHRLLLDIISILFLSALTIFICNRVRIPAIVGFLLAGILVGPRGLNIVSSVTEVEMPAEIGVVLLMFSIGIEFSFEGLLKIKKTMFLGGLLQAGGTFAVFLAVLPPARRAS